MFYYAFLNADDIVEQIISLPTLVNIPQYINIPTEDKTLIGKKYNRTTGEFEKIEKFVQVTEEEKQFMMGVPVASFSQKEEVTLTGPFTKDVTIPFDTKRLGYMPRRVYVQFKHNRNFGGVNDMFASTAFAIERDENGKYRYWLDFAIDKRYGEKASGFSKNAVFEYGKISKSDKPASKGGLPFVLPVDDNTDPFSITISKFSYDETSVKFKYSCNTNNFALTLKYNAEGLVF